MHFLANKSAIIFIYDNLKVKRPRRSHSTLKFPHFNQVSHNLSFISVSVYIAPDVYVVCHKTNCCLSATLHLINQSLMTLSRWLRFAGNHMSIFKVHSARGASSSVCRSSSVSLPFILFRVDWSNNKSFKKFYDNPSLLIEGEHFFISFRK